MSEKVEKYLKFDARYIKLTVELNKIIGEMKELWDSFTPEEFSELTGETRKKF